MKKSTFGEIWNYWAEDWLKSGTLCVNNADTPVSSLCSLREDYGSIVCKRYLKIKEIIKDAYFSDSSKRLSRYKRAAIVAYAINGSNPLEYKSSLKEDDVEKYFLKQRLAFHVAIGSIIQDYPKEKVLDIIDKDGALFDFKNLGTANVANGEDDFLMSVYKDLFFSEIYDNYNVLTMANMFGLLVERASKLSMITPN